LKSQKIFFDFCKIKKKFWIFGETACKNQHRYSAAGEESPIFLFKSKNQRRDPSDLCPQDDGQGKLIKILKHSQFLVNNLKFSCYNMISYIPHLNTLGVRN
jgi:hypothetical protein